MILIRTKYLYPSLIVIVIFLFASFYDIFPNRPQTGFRAMEGTLVTHHFEDQTDSLSGSELFELQDYQN